MIDAAKMDQLGVAATALLTWLEMAGLRVDGGKTYLTSELEPPAVQFADYYKAVKDDLWQSTRELIDRPLKTILDRSNERTMLSAVELDMLQRGLALAVFQAKGEAVRNATG